MEDPKKGALNVEVPDDGRTSPGEAHITLERFNTATRNVLRKFDDNGDGRIDANEIQAVVSKLVAERFKSKAFRIGLIVMGIFTVILLGAMFGLTWAVVAALKDTQVQGGRLTTNDHTRATVMTASTELLVQRGRLVERGPDGASTGNVLSTAAYIGSRAMLSPDMPMDVLMGVQMLVLVTPNGGQLALSVQAIARIPSNTTTGKRVLKLQTPAGLLVVEQDGSLTVQGEPGQLLLDAGFTAAAAGTGGRRHLLEATRYYISCSTHDCTSWTPDQRQECGGTTGISCDAIANDDEYMFVDSFPPPPSSDKSTTPVDTDNSGTAGFAGSCGGTRIAVSYSNCARAALWCVGNGQLTHDYWSTFVKANVRCQPGNCNNAPIWAAASLPVYMWDVLTLSIFDSSVNSCYSVDGSRTFDFCCP